MRKTKASGRPARLVFCAGHGGAQNGFVS